MFSKNIRTVYLYTVCFITLMMCIGGIIATVNAAANYFLPVIYVPYYFDRIHEDDQLKAQEAAGFRAIDQKRMEEERKAQIENERVRNLRNILSSSAVWLIAVPIFALHWKRIPKEEKEHGDDKS
jgi:hypothetical protein